MEKPQYNNHGHALTLPIGPLKYRLLAHDQWGAQILDTLAAHVCCAADSRDCDRTIHLLRFAKPQQDLMPLPNRLAGLLPGEEACKAWRFTGNPVNAFWSCTHSRQAFWTGEASDRVGKLRFQLPWNLVIEDCVSRGGGLVHAGLASTDDRGLLFLAPPGGGKTTTLMSAPGHWSVLSDDAALVWPGTEGEWLASPLPAWGNLTTPEQEWRYPKMQLQRFCRLTSLLVLKKSAGICLEKTPATQILPALYRALGEYPVTIMAEATRQEASFRVASSMVRELSCWRLTLPLNGDIWPLLHREVA